MKYDVYFIIGKKKLKITVEAQDEKDAKYEVIKAIEWKKIVPKDDNPDNDAFNFLMNTFGMS